MMSMLSMEMMAEMVRTPSSGAAMMLADAVDEIVNTAL